MKKRNKQQKTVDLFKHFRKGSRLEHCPFLYRWLEAELGMALKMPKKPSREGIPKGSPMPMPRYKMILILLQIAHPKLSLKKFAETYNLSYGTVRNWNYETEFNERQEELMNEYVILFVHRLKELIEAPGDDFGPVGDQLQEVGNYQDFLITLKIRGELEIILNDISEKFKKGKLVKTYWDYSAAYHLFLSSTFRKGFFENPESLRTVIESAYNNEKIRLEAFFNVLLSYIGQDDLKGAATMAKLLQSIVLEGLMIDTKDLALNYHDLKYQKRARKK
jgi:hypothetical protein